MSLTQYKKKRTFDKTPEPQAGKPDVKQLKFVIQKHAASRLHYDFRLEMDGVLKSWAVPKGPSLDPTVKRLAMMVEDHPFDYKDFEGIIPEGNYGAGTMIVWDEGTYEPIAPAKGKKAQEKILLKDLKEGSLKFVLHGKKLHGEFALVKTKGMAENAWLLIKHRDDFAKTKDITKDDKSVVSGKTLETIAKTSKNIYGEDPQPAKKDDNGTTEKPASKKKVKQRLEKQIDTESASSDDPAPDVSSILKKASKEKFPTTFSPMLATLVDKPFDDPGWQYEVKWDGYRAVALMNNQTVELKSRNNKSFNDQFYPVYDAIKKWGIHAVVDGEIVVVDNDGLADFSALQNWRSEADGALLYYVFDVLWLNGKNLTSLTQRERGMILQTLIPDSGIIRRGFSVEARGTEFFEVASNMGLEGIIAKRADSQYFPGTRSRDWLKIKVKKRQEVVIAGYTRNKGTSKAFSALLLGVYQDSELRYAGKVGTGFGDNQQKELLAIFKPLETTENPFPEAPEYNKPSRFRPKRPDATAVWLKPKLVCEINFTEITQDGVFRHPSFIALRQDKNPTDVIMEKTNSTHTITGSKPGKKDTQIVRAADPTDKKTLLNPSAKSQVRKVNGRELKFTNLDKIFWPDEKLTKRDLINYYYQMAPYILPYLDDRPQSLNRFPNGIKGKNFYQKDVTGKVPDWAKTYKYRTDDDDYDKHFLVGDDEATLLFMANLGAIELHPWSSTTHQPDHPTWCIMDLDPDKNSFEQVIEAAQVTHAVLEEMAVPSYPKTSGSTGLHIYIPLGAKYTYEQSKEFARVVVTMVHERLPDFTSLERAISARKGKMYLDFLQNRPQATIAAPYSLRPKPGATVSMPLDWDEVKPGLKMQDFNISNAFERVKKVGDLFKPVLGKGIDLQKIIDDMA
jgi:bifunctional non-homologous end joining protein LigD